MNDDGYTSLDTGSESVDRGSRNCQLIKSLVELQVWTAKQVRSQVAGLDSRVSVATSCVIH
jgi:hypothetical protein